jgi:putative membrane protein
VTDPPAGDAVRRTRLANERTYLAWLRTGIASLATALAVGRLLPALTDGENWPYAVIGGGWALVGIAIVAYGLRRAREVEEAVVQGEFAPLSGAAVLAITGVAVALGVGTFVVVVAQA